MTITIFLNKSKMASFVHRFAAISFFMRINSGFNPLYAFNCRVVPFPCVCHALSISDRAPVRNRAPSRQASDRQAVGLSVASISTGNPSTSKRVNLCGLCRRRSVAVRAPCADCGASALSVAPSAPCAPVPYRAACAPSRRASRHAVHRAPCRWQAVTPISTGNPSTRPGKPSTSKRVNLCGLCRAGLLAALLEFRNP